MQHLRPETKQKAGVLAEVEADDLKAAIRTGAIMPMPEEPTMEFDTLAGLQVLREQFPADRIEKLPKPLWKGAWDGERKGNCPECHGYHVLANTIHLDYVGHANCTDRLLEADPWWDWEPLAYTADGLPLFDRAGGLWIKLTVCGMTRLGYGDGNSPKEVIGDAIRNAAMRFGVALDLWAKINLHEERNPGDGPTQPQSRQQAGGRPQGRREGDDPVSAPDPAPNQEALDELASVCDRHGYDRRSCGPMYAEWASQQENPGTPRLIDAEPDAIRLFTASLIAMATSEPSEGDGVSGPQDQGESAQVADEGQPAVPADATEGDTADADVDSGRGTVTDPTDTSDVEKKPDDIF